ncbi:hypothetical protein HPP92_005178 [Vanilla planifolia]|uniref:X8 domain-containing protein n=1 Tax=Vanilla planifolia TaxID=51239 RepID=A0A835RGC0_VANPL|nr:hypothetical protein HPP92_005178 [Vanilla planifolia]
MGSTFPALKNIQKALDAAGVGDRIKAVVPLNSDVYDSATGMPSGGAFRSDIRDLMVQIVRFLHSKGSPFVVNIYPFLSLQQNKHFPVNFAFFDNGGGTISDGGNHYTNVFDANYDTLVWALKNLGFKDMDIIVGEVGWPTNGAPNANTANAKRFYDGFFKKMASNRGTPLRPGPMEVYLFSLIDENMKSILPGNFERHWGLFTYDGKLKFPVDFFGKGNDRFLVGAKGVEYLPSQWCIVNPVVKDLRAMSANMEYACGIGDCTPLSYGGSCNHLRDSIANASYAFNIYFQMQGQDVRACDFQGLATITTKNASRDGCLFPVQIVSAGERITVAFAARLLVAVVVASNVMISWVS